MKRYPIWLSVAVIGAVVLAACGTGQQGDDGDGEELTPVSLQLQWAPQAQFAGYFAAAELGYYADEGLEVTIIDGGPDVIPQAVGCAPDGPEFTISWVPKVLEARQQDCDLVNIAQVFQRSGTLSVAWADSGISGPADFADKRVGVWDFGNEFEVTAAARAEGLEENVDYEKVIQQFDMVAFLAREIDVAEAMIYNEYAQVLEAENPDTGELYQPEDMTVIDYNEVGTAMLQDALFSRAAWLAEDGNEDVAERFLRASFRGWIHCRDNPEDCIELHRRCGLDAGCRPPGVDDERDQPADLAVAERDRGHGPRPLAADGRHQPRVGHHRRGAAGRRLPHRSRRGGSRGDRGGHDRRGLHEGHGRGHAGRRIDRSDPRVSTTPLPDPSGRGVPREVGSRRTPAHK